MRYLYKFLFVIFLYSCEKDVPVGFEMVEPYIGKYSSNGYLDNVQIENHPEWTAEITANGKFIFKSFGSPFKINEKITTVNYSQNPAIYGELFDLGLGGFRSSTIEVGFRSDTIFFRYIKLKEINPYQEKIISGIKE